MGRFARSWDLFKTSFGVIKQDKELLWLPILSGLATLVAIAGVAGIGVIGGVVDGVIAADGFTPVAYATLFLGYLAVAFVQVFFFAATVAGANERLAGGDPTLGSALGRRASTSAACSCGPSSWPPSTSSCRCCATWPTTAATPPPRSSATSP